MTFIQFAFCNSAILQFCNPAILQFFHVAYRSPHLSFCRSTS
jgi:hypothetical protein